MRWNIDQWIASVQAKPEPVRVRYMVGSVAVAMLLVIGVWSLSVTESFRTVSTETASKAREAHGLLPKASDFSLDKILSGEKTLEERKKEVSGELFFQQQLESRNKTKSGVNQTDPTSEDSTSADSSIPEDPQNAVR